MSIFDKLREENPAIRVLVKFQKSIFYPIIFGIICVISSLNEVNIYVPLIWALSVSVVFGAIFNDDLKVFIVPFLMIYYAIGMDYEKSFVMTNGNIWARFDTKGLLHFLICGLLMVSFLIYRLIVSGALKNIFKKRTSFLIGILALDVVFIINGVFSEHWVLESLLFGALNAAVITLVYLVFIGIFRTSTNFVPYLCKIMVCFGYMVFAQIIILCYKLCLNDMLFRRNDLGEIISIARSNIVLSWGVSTIIGAVISLAIPAAFYLARNHKFGVFFYISAFVFWGSTFITNTRSAILCGFIAIVVSIFICWKGGRNEKINRITTVSAALIGIAIITALIITLDLKAIVEEICQIFRFDGDSSGRVGIWKRGLENFFSDPVLGTGFAYGELSKDIPFDNLYSNMYHNIIVEMLASVGVVGLLALIIHVFGILKILFSKVSGDKSLLLLTPLLVLAMSMFDNFFFYPNIQIVYVAFLAAAEIYNENGKKQSLWWSEPNEMDTK